MDDQDRLTAALADRYRVEREIGRGGMATVYLAEDLKHHRRVAIKVLHPELAAGLGAERFMREIEISARLSHPHILPLFDSGQAGGFLYYVMPYVEGDSLRDRLERDGKLSVDEAIRLTDQVSSALTYAHAQGVVHRDIKPANILLTGDQAVIADFGIARALEAASTEGLTMTGMAVGTPAYMSPEQAMGEKDVDARTDIYALGCVLFEMVSGGLPFDGTDPQAMAAKVAPGRAPSLKRTDPEIPVYLDRAVAMAMATDPGDRFDTAGEFSIALTTGTIVPAVRTPQAQRAGRRAGLVAAVVVVLALAAWWINTTLSGDQIMQSVAVLPLQDLTNDPEQEFLVAGVHESLIKELGQLGLSVTSRRTTNQYLNTDKGIAEIAEELGVDGVIEGSVFRGGDSLEIATRLLDRDEREVWAGSFDGVLQNVVVLYRGFARAIADQIQLRLSPDSEAHLDEASPVNPETYELYLRGMQLLNNAALAQEDNQKAIGYFNQAIERNPADARAHAGLALGWATIGHGPDPPLDAWPRAREAAERAIRLDSMLAEGWAALADYKTYSERDWEGAEQAFQRANRLNPSLAMNHYHYAWYLALFGRVEQAVSEHRRAAELDPLTPLHTLWIPSIYRTAGDSERALREARIVAEEYPQYALIWRTIGHCAADLGLTEEALAAMERAVEIRPGLSPDLAQVYARTGRTDDAVRILRELETAPAMPGLALGLAKIHAALGNRDEALRWLAYEPPHAWVAWFTASTRMEPYRDDPRFQAVARRMNLRVEPGDTLPTPLPILAAPPSGAAELAEPDSTSEPDS